ncbi:MAG TPA: NAD(P)-dependent alcohol dehydrogenase [Ignavibacteriaceae bacterium]|nr:NAD(P)-dependent alcohol dehydrogenase [Ignavibacteriaceae bacterium]
MKAIIYTKYGPPEVLQLKEVERPVPKDNEVLVKVIAASANPADWHMIRGEPKFARLAFGLTKPKNIIPGIDIAGKVEAVGKNAKEFQPGDEVFGDCGWGGAFAEYVCVTENRLVLKPVNNSFEEAATVSVAGITALQSLHDKGKIQSGQNVLINGASGGVGTFAVQLAKYFDAEVTGVCSTRNLELVRSIGADKVIDYTKEDFTKAPQKYDLIIDNVANRSAVSLKRALNPNGVCVIAGFSSLSRMFQQMFLGPIISMAGNKKIVGLGTAKLNKKDLLLLKDLLEAGKIKPVIDRRYPLSEVPEAIRYLEKGHARGKVVITIGHNSIV